MKSRIKKFFKRFKKIPKDKKKLSLLLRRIHKEKKFLDLDSLSMMESVLQISDLKVSDIMIPKSNIVCIDEDMELSEIINIAIKSGHSRFPVVSENNEIEGILIAKDLLSLMVDQDAKFNLHGMLRPSVIVPESKTLIKLLREFQSKHNHVAVVVDEYGVISGLITLEDIVEQIIGDVIDEHDSGEAQVFIIPQKDNSFTIKGLTPIEDINNYFDLELDDTKFDTIGGLVIHKNGSLPQKNDKIELGGLLFTVMLSDNRRVRLLRVERKNNV